MNKRRLGRTHLYVSEFCLSTAKSGWIKDEPTLLGLLDAYRSEGGNFIQSTGFCPNPAVTQPAETLPEEIVGRWWQSRRIPRDRVVLSTRITFGRPAHGGSVFFANLIRQCCESSLRRLQTTHLDMLVCEWDEQLAPIGDVVDAFDMLIRAGLVRYVAAAGFPSWRVVDSLHRSAIRNHCRFEAVQSEYSLINRARLETEALAMCLENRLGFIAQSPLAGGFLANSRSSLLDPADADPNWLSERFGNCYGDSVLNALETIAEARRASPAQIALAWVLRNPQVTAALISPTSTDDLGELVESGEILLTDEEVRALSNVTNTRDFSRKLRHA